MRSETQIEKQSPMSKKIDEQTEDKRTANVRRDIPPTTGYSLEVDGKLKKDFSDPESALEAGIELKKKFQFIQVKVYDAKAQTRTPVELPEA